MQYILEIYETSKKKRPFNDYIDNLDLQIRQKIRMRLERLSLGNFGNCESIGEGASEIKLDFGPGYRIYFSLIGKDKILILFAGTKRTQTKDIEKSKKFLKDFKDQNKKIIFFKKV